MKTITPPAAPLSHSSGTSVFKRLRTSPLSSARLCDRHARSCLPRRSCPRSSPLTAPPLCARRVGADLPQNPYPRLPSVRGPRGRPRDPCPSPPGACPSSCPLRPPPLVVPLGLPLVLRH